MLREKDVIISDDFHASATLINSYFVNITADSDLKTYREDFYDTPTSVYSITKDFKIFKIF